MLLQTLWKFIRRPNLEHTHFEYVIEQQPADQTAPIRAALEDLHTKEKISPGTLQQALQVVDFFSELVREGTLCYQDYFEDPSYEPWAFCFVYEGGDRKIYVYFSEEGDMEVWRGDSYYYGDSVSAVEAAYFFGCPDGEF